MYYNMYKQIIMYHNIVMCTVIVLLSRIIDNIYSNKNVFIISIKINNNKIKIVICKKYKTKKLLKNINI